MNHKWAVATLGDICEKPQYGFTASAESAACGPRFLRITDLKNGNLNWDNVPYCRGDEKQLSRYLLKNGDLVVARIGATTGKTSLITNVPSAVFASYLIRLRPKPKVNPYFLYFLTQSVQYWSWINGNKDNNLKGGVNAGVLTQIEFEIPPLFYEQQKIAAILWKIQQAIELQEKLITTTKELKQAAMRQLFTKGLRGEKQKETEIGLVPESWEVVELESVLNKGMQNGAFIKNPKIGASFLYVNVVDMYDETYVDLKRLERIDVNKSDVSQYLLENGDVLFVRSSLKREGIGQSCMVKNLKELAFYDCHLIRISPDTKQIIPEWLVYYWRSMPGKAELIRRSKTTTMTTINQQSLGRALLPLPSLPEQKDIIDILLSIDANIQFKKKKKQVLSSLFQSTLNELMTGQIRVADLKIDVSAVTAS